VKLDRSHVGKVVTTDGHKVIEVPHGAFAKGDIVLMFNNTDEFVCIQTDVPKAYVSARVKPRTVVEFPPRALGNVLFIDEDTIVFSGDLN
jgi:hypothetical protein